MGINELPVNNLNKIMEFCHQKSQERSFWDKEKEIDILLMSIVSELSGALGAYKNEKRSNWALPEKALYSDSFFYSKGCMEAYEEQIKDTFEDKIANVFIQLFDLCGELNINEKYHFFPFLNFKWLKY